MANTISVRVLGDISNISRNMNTVTNQLGGIQRTAGRVSGAMKGLFAGLVVGQAVSAIKDVVSAASDAQQSIGATETVFGKYADGVIANSKRAATAVGLSANEYRELSNVTGALLNGAGVPLKRLGGLTDGINKRAADMAATFGGTTREAVEAISSLMKGEADPIERYGVSIKESDISARLAAKGLDGLTGSALKQAQMQARLDLLMQKTTKSQGAFKRESNTLAHQQQVLGAQFENLKVTIGSVLLPVLTKVFAFVNDNFRPAMQRLSPVVDTVKEAFGEIGDALAPVGDWFRKHPEVIKGAGIALGIAAAAAGVFAIAMGAVALATSPITLTVLAIAAVGGAIAYAYKNSETFRNGVNGILEALKGFGAAVLPIIQQVAAAFMEKWGEIAPTVMGYWDTIKTGISDAMELIRVVVETVTNVIQAVWQRFGGNILQYVTSTFQNIATFIGGVLNVIGGIIKVVLSVIKGDWRGAWNGIKQIVSGVLQAIRAVISQVLNVIRFAVQNAWAAIKAVTSGVWNGIKAVISGVLGAIKGVVSSQINAAKSLISAGWNAAKSLTTSAWNGIKTAVSNAINGVLSLVRGIPGKITGALGNLGSLLFNAGSSIIGGLIDGIQSKIGDLTGALGKITDKIPDWKGPAKRDAVLLKGNGRLIMQGLIDGFEDGAKGVRSYLKKMTKEVGEAFSKKYDDPKKARTAARNTLSRLAQEAARLSILATRYAKVNKRLVDAKKRLEDLKKARNDYATKVKDAVLDYGSITNLNSAFTADAMIQQMKARIQKVKEYQSLLERLKGLGLNKAMYDDLVQAGVEGGFATATALAQGGAQAISEFNALQTELNNTATTMGNQTANTMYQAGIQAAQGLVNGLNKKANALEKAAQRLANAMVKQIKKALGIKSPSRVFRRLGEYTVQGMEIGLRDTSGVARGMTNLSKVMTNTFDPTLTTSARAQSAAGTQQVVIQVNVPPTADKAAIGREIQSTLDAYYRKGGRRQSV